MEEKITAWIARDKVTGLHVYNEKPHKSDYYPEWVSVEGKYFRIDDSNLFPQVKWEDDEPTKVELTIKICE